MSDPKAFMVGPRAENLAIFRQLILEVLDDHMYWRRNFYPEDDPVISSADQHSAKYGQFVDRLRDLLFEFLADAKKGIPFFSPRYIGHMNTDLLLAAQVGYFASMLYNQNNVAGESSPVTVRLEKEVMVMLAKMVGFPIQKVKEKDGKEVESAAGYLTSGGTTANIYSLWIARNLRSWPLALRLAVRIDPENGKEKAAVNVLRNLPIRLASGNTIPLNAASPWQLLNLPLETLYRLRDLCFETCVFQLGEYFPERKAARATVEELVGRHTPQALGERVFLRSLRKLFPGDDGRVFERPWQIVVAQNKHYSWIKAADLLGLGHRAVHEISHSPDFVMDPAELRRHLQKCFREEQTVLMVVTLFGATEEGSLDDLLEVETVRRELEKQGLTVWHHVDACYGGYLGTIVRPELEAEPTNGAQVHAWMIRVASELGISEAEASKYTNLSEEGDGWLTWDQLVRRTKGLKHADSVTIDPHKLGYVPYPAGAVLLRDPEAWEIVSVHAPYLWCYEKDPAESFVGRYTLEGSRPGATAAACWLAHMAVPLCQSGHGKLIAASMLSTRRLYFALKERETQSDDIGIAFLNRPHTNMLCYVPYHRSTQGLEEIAEVTRAIAKKLKPTHRDNFMAVQTELLVKLNCRSIRSFFPKLDNPPQAAGEVKMPVLRSVVMSPLALNARTREGNKRRHLFDVYVDYLFALTRETFSEVTIQSFARSFRAEEIILVMDDHDGTIELMRRTFSRLADKRIVTHIKPRKTVEEALELVRRYNRPLRVAFLDIDMGPGHEDGGYEVFEAICERNLETVDPEDRVRLVVFLTVGDKEWASRCNQTLSRYKVAMEFRYLPKRVAEEQPDEEFVRQIHDLLISVRHANQPR